MTMESASKKPNSLAESSDHPQFDLFGNENSDSAKSWEASVSSKLSQKDFRNIFLLLNSEKESDAETYKEFELKINSAVDELIDQRLDWLNTYDVNTRWNDWFHSFRPMTPTDHFNFAGIQADGPESDWEKVSSDLRLSFLKTMSESIQAAATNRLRHRRVKKHA